MKEKKELLFKVIMGAFLIINSIAISAQTIINFPYFEGFEDESLDYTWEFENGNFVNQWYIGEATASGGKRSLYISGDGGKSATYENSTSGVGAYKEFYLPDASKRYEISFDWKVQGEPSSNKTPRDSLFAFWLPDETITFTSTEGEIPRSLIAYQKPLNQNDELVSGEVWHRASFTVSGSDSPGRLVFFWVNNSTNRYPPSGCIDNIQINLLGSGCERPQNLKTSFEGGARLDFTGSAPFQLKYKNEMTGEWTEVDEVIYSSPYTVTNLDKGIYTFWLRSICNVNDTSAWTVASNMIVAVSMDKCINFVDLYNEKVVDAKYGNYGQSAKAHDGVMDYGYKSVYSRHAIHFQPDEVDQRTVGDNIRGLKTVPPGELASVRIGNWGHTGEAQSLSYSLTVDQANPILILNFAAVLLNVGHTPGDGFGQPRFILRVTDEGDIPLDQNCTTIEYLASYLPGWNYIPLDPQEKYHIVWKDWTTLGINLRDYIGRRVKVYLETGDCVGLPDESCYGYGYFSLDCASDKLTGLTCGTADPSLPIDTIYAPKGFKYEWFKATDPNRVLYETRYFVPEPGDTATYKCRMTFDEIGKQRCYFELTAALLPRDPVADATFTVCQREVQFYDKSYVVTQNGVTGEECEVSWYFEDGDVTMNVPNPVYQFSTPGTHKVKLTASITGGDQVCWDEYEFEVTVSDDTIKEIINDTICYKQFYMFGSSALIEAGTYTDTLTTIYGCDSILILNLEMYPTIAYDTICGGQTYVFEGEELTLAEGLHPLTYKNVKSLNTPCDSTLMLFIAPEVSVQSVGEICADDEFLLYNITVGVDSVYIEYSNESSARGYVNNTVLVKNNTFNVYLPDEAYAGIVTGKFITYSSYCGTSTIDFAFDVKYPEAVIAQRWNDVLAIKSKGHNGGYNFIGYQWYRNGEKLQGETKSYLFVPEGLNPEDRYSAELIREDNVVMFTCEYTPENLDADLTLVDNKTQVNQSFTIQTNEEGSVRLYTVSGNLISEYKLSAGINQLKAPSTAGYYLLEVMNNEQKKTYFLQVTQ